MIIPLVLMAVQVTTYAPETAPREVRFANPPASCRILLIQHGRPADPNWIERNAQGWKDDGFGGFAGNAGWDHGYLNSPEDMNAYAEAVRASHKLGQSVWLYDEKGYPSATAGGLTLEGHPEWQARAYLIAVTNAPVGANALPPSPPGTPVATIRRPLSDGKTERVFLITDAYILEGTHISVSVSHFKYPYPNLLMKEPTARFIELTHEAYKKVLGHDLSDISCTFTDEPSLMTHWFKPMPYYCLPVSDGLLRAYRVKSGGHNLADDVPEMLFGAGVGEVAAKRHLFWSLVGERVALNYTGQLTAWARKNGIQSGGHLLAEESIASHPGLYGDFFRVLRGLSSPGCDMLTSIPEQVTWLTPLLAASASELNGAPFAMSESSDYCEKDRAKGDTRPVIQVTDRQVVGSLNRQIWAGINTFTSYYRWEPFSRESRRAINDEIGREITLLREGPTAAEIALLYPSDALMVGYEPQLVGGSGFGSRRCASLLRAAGGTLFNGAQSFMFVDASTLADAELEGNALTDGSHHWRIILLPAVTTLPRAAMEKLAALSQAGGLVLSLGPKPVNSETRFPDTDYPSLSSSFIVLPEGLMPCLPDLLKENYQPPLEVIGATNASVRVAHHRSSEGDVFFVLNDSSAPWRGSVQLQGSPAVRVGNPRTGTFSDSLAGAPVALDLPPYGGVLLTTAEPVQGVLNKAGSSSRVKLVSLANKASNTFLSLGPNVKGEMKDLPRGGRHVETRLIKSREDSFAFVNFAFAHSPFTASSRGVAFHLKVLGNPSSQPVGYVFLRTPSGQNWYVSLGEVFAEAGEQDIPITFSGLELFRDSKGSGPFDPTAICQVTIGYGGYHGTEGEPIDFEVSAPSSIEVAH